jgi:hypothetical protein
VSDEVLAGGSMQARRLAALCAAYGDGLLAATR